MFADKTTTGVSNKLKFIFECKYHEQFLQKHNFIILSKYQKYQACQLPNYRIWIGWYF